MKHALLFTTFILHSMITASEDITKLLIDSRTDLMDVSSIQSANLNSKNSNDRTLKEALKLASNLLELSAQDNNLCNPEPTYCAFLTSLDLNNSKIKKFCIGDWLTAMPALQTLKLAHNKITIIASHNDISTLTCGRFYCCGGEDSWKSESLQELDVSHNQLTTFDLNIINNAPNLVKADFSDNEIAHVTITSDLNQRKTCAVLLHKNKLSEAQKQILNANNSLYTQEYNTNYGTAAMGGGLGGAVVLGGFTGAYVASLFPSIGVAFIGVAFGTIIGGFFIGGATVGGIAAFCYPKDKRTYKPFVYKFEKEYVSDASDDSNDTIIELED